MQIAILFHGCKRISLWANVIRRYPNGTITFDVINGAWRGSIRKDGTIYIDGEPQVSGDVVWEGTAPFRPYNDYTAEAIEWIQEQIGG